MSKNLFGSTLVTALSLLTSACGNGDDVNTPSQLGSQGTASSGGMMPPVVTSPMPSGVAPGGTPSATGAPSTGTTSSGAEASVPSATGAPPSSAPAGAGGMPLDVVPGAGGIPSGAGGVNAGGAGGMGPDSTATGGAGGDASGDAGGATPGTGGVDGMNTGGADSGADELFSDSFLQVAELLHENCGSKCHNGSIEAAHLINLSSDDLGALYDQLTMPLDTDLCYNQQIVVPGSPETSVIVEVLRGPIEEPCVLIQMPAGCGGDTPCLEEADIAILENWISEGAPRN